MKKNSKTNVCRILDSKKIKYEFVVRDEDKEFEEIGIDRNICFKTLVLEGSDKNHYWNNKVRYEARPLDLFYKKYLLQL